MSGYTQDKMLTMLKGLGVISHWDDGSCMVLGAFYV